jgi:hypothetical protein
MTAKLQGLNAHLPMLTLGVGAAPAVRPLERHIPVRASAAEPRRRRIWELSGSFHCSIIGTCLTTSELRQVLNRMPLPGVHKESDHALHGRAVLLAGKKDHTSKLLQKALDRRHRSVISQFGKARNVEELRHQWATAVHRAEIPGAYWAVMTHPEATEDLVRHVFGEVHMLSHLVGAANRADIRRLRELEIENAALQEKVARQQTQLRDAVVTREATIANLSQLLGKAIARQERKARTAPDNDMERDTTAHLVADLRDRLEAEAAAGQRAERRLHRLIAQLGNEKRQRHAVEQRELELQREIEVLDLSLSKQLPAPESEEARDAHLKGATLLYVGGRAHQVAHLRMLAEQRGATLLHHDGGIDDRSGLLAAQVARADLVFFPVDCVSHNAVAVVKRVSRQIGKHYVALRTSGLTSFAAALHRDVARARMGTS